MKLVLSCFFLFAVTLSLSTFAHSSFLPKVNSMRATQEVKMQLKVNSSQQAAQIAKARLGGKVLKVQKLDIGYRVKLMKNDGHIVSVFIDARSGRISSGN